MKKMLIVLLAILGLSTIAIFVFIPSQLKVSHAVYIHTTDKWATKFITDSSAWKAWFPKEEGSQANTLNGLNFSTDSLFYNAFKINIQKGDDITSSIIHLLSLKRDSLAVVWDCPMKTSYNPAKRLEQYGLALQIKKSMTTILDSLKSFMDKTENVYGIHITHAKIIDSILLSTKTVFDEYPTDEQVYTLLGNIENYYKKFGAVQNGNPMLNITHYDGRYQTQVAIPINKDVPESKDFTMKYMFRGNTLRADITGGHREINKALDGLAHYKSDFSFISPAIAFQSIVTNRMEVKDSSQWKTIVFLPIK